MFEELVVELRKWPGCEELTDDQLETLVWLFSDIAIRSFKPQPVPPPQKAEHSQVCQPLHFSLAQLPAAGNLSRLADVLLIRFRSIKSKMRDANQARGAVMTLFGGDFAISS